MSDHECCCEFAPQFREIERRAKEDILDALKDAFGGVDEATIAKLKSGDLLKVLQAIMSLDLEAIAQIPAIVTTAEEIAADHKAIVSEMEERCESGGEEPEEPEHPSDDEIYVAEKDHHKIFDYETVGKKNGPRVESRDCGVAIWEKQLIPVHDTPDFDEDGELDESQGVQWMIAEVAPDEWLAASFEWSRPNSDSHDWKTLHCEEKFHGDFIAALKAHLKESRFDDWTPKSGDQIGWFRSTNARFGSQRYVPTDERVRTHIRWKTVPAEWLD